MMNLLVVTTDGEPLFLNMAHIVRIAPTKTDDFMASPALVKLINGDEYVIGQTVAEVIAAITQPRVPEPQPAFG